MKLPSVSSGWGRDMVPEPEFLARMAFAGSICGAASEASDGLGSGVPDEGAEADGDGAVGVRVSPAGAGCDSECESQPAPDRAIAAPSRRAVGVEDLTIDRPLPRSPAGGTATSRRSARER